MVFGLAAQPRVVASAQRDELVDGAVGQVTIDVALICMSFNEIAPLWLSRNTVSAASRPVAMRTSRPDSARPMTGRRQEKQLRTKEVMTLRAEEGDETIDELADEAAKTKKELNESTETGKKLQEESKGSGKHT